MTGWILVTLWTSANSIAVQPTTFKHVRSAESHIRELVVDGYARSSTFNTLVNSVEGLSCIVYISTIEKLSQGMRGALLHWPAADPDLPVLRVLLKTNLSRDEGIAVIGHELQHVIEAVRGAQAAGRFDVTAVFAGMESSARSRGSRKYETEAAIRITESIQRELARARRVPSQLRPAAAKPVASTADQVATPFSNMGTP